MRGYMNVIGLIPAHAGKTMLNRIGLASSGAHPRSRGENRRVACGEACGRGSSPLTRGKPSQIGDTEFKAGLIPAHAGKTKFYEKPPLDWGAHPRSRGENTSAARSKLGQPGSSPLTRGKRGYRCV